jgi:hypothetical protein
MNEAQQELLRLNPGLDARDVPATWCGAADLDAQEYALRQRRLARERPVKQQASAARADAITSRELESTLEQIGQFIGEELNKFEVRIAELEAQTTLKYVGPWRRGGNYKPGEFVSYGGGMWHCKQNTGTRPSTCPEAWTLAVKSVTRPERKNHALA